MRARTITTIAALGLAGVLMAPMAHAATSEPPAEVQAVAAQAAAAAEAEAPDAKDGHHHGEGDFFELIGFFDFLHECVSTADFVEDHFDADTVCVPQTGHHHGFGDSHGHDGGGEDKDWLLFAAFPHWVHHHHHHH